MSFTFLFSPSSVKNTHTKHRKHRKTHKGSRRETKTAAEHQKQQQKQEQQQQKQEQQQHSSESSKRSKRARSTNFDSGQVQLGPIFFFVYCVRVPHACVVCVVYVVVCVCVCWVGALREVGTRGEPRGLGGSKGGSHEGHGRL